MSSPFTLILLISGNLTSYFVRQNSASLCLSARLLAFEIVRREADDHQTGIFLVVVELLQAGVLLGVAAAAGDVDDHDDLAFELRKVIIVAVDVLDDKIERALGWLFRLRRAGTFIIEATAKSRMRFRMAEKYILILLPMLLFCLAAAPVLDVPSSREAWKKQRAKLLEQWLAIMGPPAAPLLGPVGDPAVISTEQLEDHTRLLVAYQGYQSYLLLPKALEQHPAMVCLHPTSDKTILGPVGLANRESNHHALHLVRRGYVCIACQRISCGQNPAKPGSRRRTG